MKNWIHFMPKALFTSIPLDLARESVKSALQDQRQMLSQLTSLSSDDVLTLIDICFKGAVFQQNNVIYKQEHGTPMGSPVAVVLAELSM